MAQKKVGSSASEMLSGLKARLGFAHGDEEDEEFSRYDADFNDYDDFDDDYEEEFAEYGASYDETDSSYRAGSGSGSGSGRSSRFGRPDSTPNLVSIEDVREHSKSIINSSRGSYEDAHRSGAAGVGGGAGGRASVGGGAGASVGGFVPTTSGVSASNTYTSSYQRSGSGLGRDFVSSDGPAVSSPAYNAAQRNNAARSEGFNSLFESSAAGAAGAGTAGAAAGAAAGAGTASSEPRFAPLPTFGAREITLVRPMAYNDVEGVARALKAGNVVVLAMSITPEDLFKRVLDFSFGVASALDAHVECIADKVYVLAIGQGLTDAEMQALSEQGVL